MSAPADFVAQNFGGWWVIQTICGPAIRSYAIEKETGALFELPDDRCPFVTLNKTTNAPEGSQQ